METVANDLEGLRLEFNNFREVSEHELKDLTHNVVPFKADK